MHASAFAIKKGLQRNMDGCFVTAPEQKYVKLTQSSIPGFLKPRITLDLEGIPHNKSASSFFNLLMR